MGCSGFGVGLGHFFSSSPSGMAMEKTRRGARRRVRMAESCMFDGD